MSGAWWFIQTLPASWMSGSRLQLPPLKQMLNGLSHHCFICRHGKPVCYPAKLGFCTGGRCRNRGATLPDARADALSVAWLGLAVRDRIGA
jgi:hypothetical protein